MTPRPLNELVDEGWARALEPVEPQVAQMGEFLRAELAAGHRYLPAGQNVLRAFTFPLERFGFSSSGRTRIRRPVTPSA